MSGEVTLRINGDDFDRLTLNSMRWSASDWYDQADRFETTSRGEEINWGWTYAYWVGDAWANVILARVYLESIGEPYQVLWDMVENPDPSWVILTNYTAEAWRQS